MIECRRILGNYTMQAPNIPGYELLECVGSSGLSEVWLAKQISLDRPVAIKLLSPDFASNTAVLEKIQTEVRAAARIEHPSVVQLYTSGECDGVVYYVMEYVPGCTVGDLLTRKGTLPEKQSLTIAEGVIHALNYAWSENGVIHCDIKPSNVLIETDGTIKVSDLGLARTVATIALSSGLTEFVGTPNYSSPEQARGDTDLDCRSDIYSLGALLYQLLTGRLPFADVPPTEILDQQRNGYLEGPLALMPELSEGVAWLLEKAMVKDRTQRYQTWDEMLLSIEEIQDDQIPSIALPAAGMSTIRRSARRKPAPTPPAPPPPVTPPQCEAPSEPPLSAQTETKVKQRIVLNADDVNEVLSARKGTASKRLRLAPLVVRLLVLLFVVGSIYGWLAYQSKHSNRLSQENARMAALPDTDKEAATFIPIPAATARSRQLPPGVASIGRRKQVDAPEVEPAITTTRVIEQSTEPTRVIQWKDPTFVSGAKSFNDALQRYTDYQKSGHLDPAELKKSEEECRDAIDTFEAIKADAPAGVPINAYINQAYHLMSDIRQSSLVDYGPAGKRARRRTKAAKRAPAPTPLSDKWREPLPEDAWDNPTFKVGTKAFNRALELYRAYQSGQNDAESLKRLEKETNTALDAFAAVRQSAPPEVNVTQRIQNCRQLVAAVRQARMFAQ